MPQKLTTTPRQTFLFVMFVFFIFSKQVKAQTDIFSSGARLSGMANTGVAISDEWSMFHNPAGMAGINEASFGAHYTNRYLLPDIGIASVSGILPMERGTFGTSLSYFGTTRYNEQKYAFGYAHKLGGKLSAGISIDYYRLKLPEDYEQSGVLAGEIGLVIHPVKNLSVGCRLNNVSNSKYSTYSSGNVPSDFSLGAAWKSDIFLIASQVNIYEKESPSISAGSEVLLMKSLAIRVGVSSLPLYQYTLGLGYRQKSISGNVAFSRHPVLGMSSFISLSHHFSSRRNQ